MAYHTTAAAAVSSAPPHPPVDDGLHQKYPMSPRIRYRASGSTHSCYSSKRIRRDSDTWEHAQLLASVSRIAQNEVDALHTTSGSNQKDNMLACEEVISVEGSFDNSASEEDNSRQGQHSTRLPSNPEHILPRQHELRRIRTESRRPNVLEGSCHLDAESHAQVGSSDEPASNYLSPPSSPSHLSATPAIVISPAGDGFESLHNQQYCLYGKKQQKMIPTTRSNVTVLRRKFSWKNYPELEAFLVANREEYLRHSALNYTVQQKQYNNQLTERLLEVAAEHGYVFDEEVFSFVAIRDRIRCYFKSYVQSSKKRGVIIGYAARKSGPADLAYKDERVL